MIPAFRTINNPNFSIRENNEILTYIKQLIYADGINSNKYGTQILNYEKDPRYIALRVTENIPPYSIILAQSDNENTPEFYNPIALANGFLATEIRNPYIDVDTHRYTFCTNGSLSITFSSSSSSSSSSSNSSSSSSSSEQSVATLQCHIIGTHRPHLIRTYSDIVDSPYYIGDRVDIRLDGSGKVEHSSTGPFTCVSTGDRDRKLVWIVAHHHQLSYIPWVKTTTSAFYPTYPSIGSNTFVVERGSLLYNNSNPGTKTYTWIPHDPANKVIAISVCGYLPENTIRRMTFDRGKYYLLDDCNIPV